MTSDSGSHLRAIKGGRSACQETTALFLIALIMLFGALTDIVIGGTSPYGGSTTIVPNANPLLFGSSGNLKVDIPKPGIAVRIEIPREFLGSVSSENDTSFITSNVLLLQRGRRILTLDV